MISLLRWLRKKDTDLNTAVVIDGDTIGQASIHWRNGTPILTGCLSRSAADNSDALEQLAGDAGLAANGCATVMPLGSYHLLLIEAPEVPANELRAAVRWRIRELIDYHIDDAVLDVFDAPAGAARGAQTHLYVVVSRSNDVKHLADRLLDAGIELGIIDIPELALRNIAARLPENEQGVAMLYLGEERGLIALCRDQTLYLARTLDLGKQRVLEAIADGHTEAMLDSLALEVQRSLDYYDRHFQQAPISNLVIAPVTDPLSTLAEALHSRLGINARMLDLSTVLEIAAELPAELTGPCVLAIGAALRTESKTL